MRNMTNNLDTALDFDDFLRWEGLYEECSEIAIKRVLARQLAEVMKLTQIAKTEMAKRMQTSRSQLDRLLDPEKTGVSIDTIQRAASVVGRQLRIELIWRLNWGDLGGGDRLFSRQWETVLYRL
jgi:antitoxin HicB